MALTVAREMDKKPKPDHIRMDLLSYLNNARDQIDENNTQFLKTVNSITAENRLLCEREAKMLEVVAEFEVQSRALATSLSEAVEKLQSQEVIINELIDENTRYMIQVKQLENELAEAMEAIERAKEAVERATEAVDDAANNACEDKSHDTE
jgi:myo-inositol-1-phosphate synthase